MCPHISIIIPIYGVERYIERCARSLFEQTFEDIEYIFVNDCTKDASIEILQSVIEDYPNRKSQIKILNHETNNGLPQARKTGVIEAKGDYILHCDSDDWLELDMCEKLWKAVDQNSADVVICDYYEDTGSERKIKAIIEDDRNSIFYNHFTCQRVCSVWNKLIKRSLYSEDIIYPVANMGEDFALIIQLFYKVKKVVYIHLPLYHYFINENSITNAKSEQCILNRYNQSVANMNVILQFTDQKQISEKLQKELDYIKFRKRDNILVLVEQKKYWKIWINTFKEINIRVIFNPFISIRSKLKYIYMILKGV